VNTFQMLIRRTLPSIMLLVVCPKEACRDRCCSCCLSMILWILLVMILLLIKLYADDVKFYSVIDDIGFSDSLQSGLNSLCDWCATWQMKINASKCFVQLE